MSESDDRPGITITATGVSAPDASDVRQYGIASYKGVYGQDLDTTPATPQGQIIDSETAVIHDKNSQLIEVLNQFDPEKNDGIWQEGIGKIYFQTRKQGSRTVVPCEITGIVGTTIPGGAAQAIDKNGNLYELSQDTPIETSSPVPVDFVALEPGAIVCPAGSLDRIYKRVPGWDTVINHSAGITGSIPEGRRAFERRRYAGVAKNAHGNRESVDGAIADLDDVISVSVEENIEDFAQVIRGVTLKAHSMWISVVGGANTAIGQTINERKDGGCAMNGNTPVTISVPTRYGTKNRVMTFNRPRNILGSVLVRINLYNTSLTTDIVNQIKQRVVDDWDGSFDVNPRVQIAEEVFASRFYCPVRELDSGRFFDIIHIKVRRQINLFAYTVNDNAFEVSERYLEAIAIPEGESNPFFETVNGYNETKAAPDGNPENSAFLKSDNYLQTNGKLTADEPQWGAWGDSFESTLDEFPVLLLENVIVEAELDQRIVR